MVARNMGWSLVGFGVPLLTMVATIPIYINRLGAVGFGVWSTANAVAGLFAVFNLDLGTATTKFVAEYSAHDNRGKVSAVVSATLLIYCGLGAAGSLALWGFGPQLAQMLMGPARDASAEAGIVFKVVACGFLPSFSLPAILGVFNGQQQYQWSQGIGLARTVLLAGIGTAVLLTGAGVATFAATQVAVTWLVWGASFGLAVRKLGAPLSLEAGVRHVRLVLAFGMKSSVVAIANTLIGAADRLVVARFAGPEMVAYYSIAQTAGAKVHAICAAAAQSLMPFFSSRAAAAQERPGIASDSAALGVAWLGSIMMAVCIGAVLIAAAPWLLHVWVSEEARTQAGTLLRIHATSATLSAMGIVPYYYLMARGQPGRVAVWTVSAATTMIVCQYCAGALVGDVRAIALCALVFPISLLGMAWAILRQAGMDVLRRAVVLGAILPAGTLAFGVTLGITAGTAAADLVGSAQVALTACLVGTSLAIGSMLLGLSRTRLNNSYLGAIREIAAVLLSVVRQRRASIAQ